jgi:predicted lysophospholipase L1 biosynthesis ABC-type transport system permease subunit
MVEGFRTAQQVSLIKITAITAAVIAATGFVVFLFIGRKKKEYAVMRALGTPKQIAARSLLLPLTAVAVTGVLAGSAAAWIYTVKTIANNNALSMLEDYAVSTAVPAGVAIGCILGELLLTLIIAALLLRRIGARAPLALYRTMALPTRAAGKPVRGRPKRIRNRR